MADILQAGQRFNSKAYGSFVVTKYVSAGEVHIQFDETGGTSKAAAGNIRNGHVRDNLARTVFKVGYLGNGNFKSRRPNNRGCTKEYGTWSAMLFRCYGENRDEATYRNYSDCSVCQEWHNFQTFAEWCQAQPEMLFEDSSLDKDIRVKGNKVYSPDTCCFVPQYINTAVTGMKHQNSSGLAGVWSMKDSYVAEVTMFGSKTNLGSFASAEDANHIHSKVKEAYISALADIFKSKISEEVFSKLKLWRC